MDVVKIGVVGLGALGELHINDIKSGFPNAVVYAVSDIRADRVAEIKEKYNIPYGYTSYDEMLENPELDAVMIVTNVAAHAQQCIKAAQKGLHIMCEKPLAKTIEECKEIERAVEANKGKIFQIGFMRRSDPAYAEAMRRVRAGEIGDVIMFKGMSLDPATVLPQHIKGIEKGMYAPFFYEMGIHDADLALWFVGEEFESVYSVGGSFVEKGFAKYNDYDNAMALGRTAGGKLIMIQVGRTHNSSHVHSEIVGTKGTIRINNIPNATRLEVFNEHGYTQPVDDGFLTRWAAAYVEEKKNFINSILTGTPPESSVYDGAKTLRMSNMMQKAFVENRMVKRDEIE